jgi:hypothetical protein
MATPNGGLVLVDRFLRGDARFASAYLARQECVHASSYDVPSEVLARPRVGMADVLEALQRLPLDRWRCKSRNNVRPAGVRTIDAITLGLIVSASSRGVPVPSKGTRLFPNLTRLLLRVLSGQEGPAECQGSSGDLLHCTSIQLNRNYAAREHVDINNRGPSWIFACGNWTSGGQLWVQDPRGDTPHVLRSDVSGTGFRRGQRMRGRVLDVRERWHRFDGRNVHFVFDFEGGARFSLVYYVSNRHAAAPAEARAFLEGLGCIFPSTAWGLAEAALRTPRLPIAWGDSFEHQEMGRLYSFDRFRPRGHDRDDRACLPVFAASHLIQIPWILTHL